MNYAPCRRSAPVAHAPSVIVLFAFKAVGKREGRAEMDRENKETRRIKKEKGEKKMEGNKRKGKEEEGRMEGKLKVTERKMERRQWEERCRNLIIKGIEMEEGKKKRSSGSDYEGYENRGG